MIHIVINFIKLLLKISDYANLTQHHRASDRQTATESAKICNNVLIKSED